MSKSARCLECGAALQRTRENVKYDASGLVGITLVNLEVRRCPGCGEREVIIPAIEQLHKTLATLLAEKRARLSAPEVRFLRKYLGLSGKDLADHLGVTPETVSRWEGGSSPIGVTADRFLRFLVLTREPVSGYPIDGLKEMAVEKARPMRVGLRVDDGGWRPDSHIAVA